MPIHRSMIKIHVNLFCIFYSWTDRSNTETRFRQCVSRSWVNGLMLVRDVSPLDGDELNVSGPYVTRRIISEYCRSCQILQTQKTTFFRDRIKILSLGQGMENWRIACSKSKCLSSTTTSATETIGMATESPATNCALVTRREKRIRVRFVFAGSTTHSKRNSVFVFNRFVALRHNTHRVSQP